MNIKDLNSEEYNVVGQSTTQAPQLNINDLPQDSFSVLNDTSATSNTNATDDTGSFFGNLAKSAKNFGSGLLNVVTHPIDTITGLAKTAIGGIEEGGNKLTGVENTPENGDTNTQAFDNLVNFFKNRYGGSSAKEVGANIAHTAYTDPIGFLTDLSAVLTGGASVVGTVGKLADVAKAGEIADLAKGAEFAKTIQPGQILNVRDVMEGLDASGVSKDRIPNIMTDLYQKNPSGQFTAEDLAHVTTPQSNIATQASDALKTGADFTNPISLAGKPITAVAKATGLTDRIGNAYEAIKSKFQSPLKVIPDNEVIDASKNLGINENDMTASMVNKNPAVNLAETFSAKGAGAGAFAEKFDNLNTQLEDIKNRTLEGAGTAQDLSTTGKKISEGLETYQDTYKKNVSQLYDEFGKKGNNLEASVQHTTDLLNDIISKQNSIGEDATWFNKKLEVITGGETSKLDFKLPTFQTLKELRTSIGQKLGAKFLDPFVKTNEGYLKSLYASITDDMNETVKASGDIKLAGKLKNAETAFKAGIKELKTGYTKQIRKLAEAGQESKIVDGILGKTHSVEDIPKIRKVIGEENFKQLQYHLLDKIFTKASNNLGKFTKEGIDNAIKVLGKDKVEAILEPEQMKTLSDLQKVIRAVEKSKAIGNGSQTAFLGRQITEGGLAFSAVGDILTGQFAKASAKLAPIIGDRLFSKFVASDTGQRLLKQGITNVKLGKNLERAGKVAGKVVKTVYNKNNIPRNIVLNEANNQQ